MLDSTLPRVVVWIDLSVPGKQSKNAAYTNPSFPCPQVGRLRAALTERDRAAAKAAKAGEAAVAKAAKPAAARLANGGGTWTTARTSHHRKSFSMM